MTQSYAISAWLFGRALSAVYFIAFLSLVRQARGLWGEHGVTPIAGFLQAVSAQTGPERYLHVPSIFWIQSSDGMIVGAAVLGMLVSLAAFAGVAQGWMWLAALMLYASFVSTGQEFLSFQWDILLIEVGFLALFAAPWTTFWGWNFVTEPYWMARWGFYLVLFKLMFLSGVVKLMSGDPSWRDLSALSYHYWTQPLPNPVSPFVHALPLWLHKISTALTFLIELPLPFLIFWPRGRLIAAVGFALLSIMIFSTGNYTFFNLLTLAVTIWLVPDSVWSRIFDFPAVAASAAPLAVNGAMGILIGLSVLWCARPFLPEAVEEKLWVFLRVPYILHISNSYGLFANMTKSRPEIVIEGSQDGETWKEYEFKYKVGDVRRAPPIIEPLQPRLDWQMWFAALGSFERNPWLQNLFVRLLEGEPTVLALFAGNPFPKNPPRYLRAKLYAYEFASPAEIWRDGLWWKRTALGNYSPVFERQ